MAKKITKKPSLAVKGLGAPTRGNGHTMTAKWTIPSSLVSTKKNNRAEGLEVDWFLGIPGTDPKKVVQTSNEKLKESSINLDNIKIGKTTYTRQSFYPLTKRTLSYVSVHVIPTNKKGKGPVAKAQRTFLKPRTPTLTALSFNTNNGVVSTTIATDAGTDYRERYDTHYTMQVTNPFENSGKTKYTSNDASTSTSFSINYDASSYMNLNYNQYIKVVASAYARGYAGKSATASRTMYISYPAQATIQGVDVSGRDVTGKCTIKINTNSSTTHPVDKVRLEYAADVTYNNANDIPASEWTSTDIVDNGKCTALSISTADLLPSRGNHTFVRVVTYHLHEGVLFRYSEPRMIKKLELPSTPSASIDIDLLNAEAGADGKSAVVLLGWNKNGQDNFTGTELSWSSSEDAWRSTEEPDYHEFTWSDGAIQYGGVTYQDSARITIKDLEEGETYYIKARRYAESDATEYSEYTETATVITSGKPESIVAYSAGVVADGDPLSIYWTLAGNSMQKEWQVIRQEEYVKTSDTAVAAIRVTAPTTSRMNKYYELSSGVYTKTSDTAPVTGKTYYIITKKYYTKSGSVYTAVASPSNSSMANYYEHYKETVIASGMGSAGSVQVSAERLKDMAIGNRLPYFVMASTGSGFVESEVQTVLIVEQPTLSITAPSTMTAQPFSFTATSNTLCDLIVIVTSQGATCQFPQGVKMQTAGDTIHSDVYTPAWANGSATITLPSGLDFWDLGKYTLSVVAIDRSTSLRSQEAVAEFSVGWTNQAVAPAQFVYTLTTDTEVVADEAYYELVSGEYVLVIPTGNENPSSEGWYTQDVNSFVTLTVIDEKDSDGDHTQAVRIELTPPTGSSETDVYDIYRMDIEKPSLIGEGFPLTHTVIDEYAPFSDETELYYRVAIRTVDGDVEFSDIQYQAECSNIRFDWSGGSLELPYGNSIGDSFAKDVDIRKHMNGSMDGYWNQNVERKSSLSSNIIKIVQPRDVERARNLARYAGPVFVRLPNGSAFEADVQVTDLSMKNKAVTAIAFDATEIGLTQEFLLPIPFELEDE